MTMIAICGLGKRSGSGKYNAPLVALGLNWINCGAGTAAITDDVTLNNDKPVAREQVNQLQRHPVGKSNLISFVSGWLGKYVIDYLT